MASQGPEWKSVFVLNVVDGCMPSDLGAGTFAEIEKERRLHYVAMTGAKASLSDGTPPSRRPERVGALPHNSDRLFVARRV